MSETEQQSSNSTLVDSNAKLLEELQLYQIELQMQNESLRQAQIALEESNDRYIDLYDFAPVAYLTLTKQGLIKEINFTGASLLGLERQKLLQRRFAGFISPTDSDRWHLFFARQIQQRIPQSIDLALKSIDGIARYVQLDCLPMMDEGSLTPRITLTDITALKQAELMRYDSEAYQSILATTQDGFCILNAEGRLLDVNQRYCELSGYSREELLCASINDLINIDTLDDVQTMIDTIIEKGAYLFEIVQQRKDGTFWPVEISVSYRKSNNQIFYVFLRDITQRKQTEQQLQESEHKLVSALDVILNHRETEPNNAKNRFSLEMDSVILPLFKKIKGLCSDKTQHNLITLLETELQQLNKAYGNDASTLISDCPELTAVEIQVALLIRQGFATKTIADMLAISAGTVGTHRKHIRKKLNLDGDPSASLRDHLVALLTPDNPS